MQHTITMMLTNISSFKILTSQGEVPDNTSFDTAKPCLIPTTAGMPGFISAFKTDYKLLRLNRVDVSANKVTLWYKYDTCIIKWITVPINIENLPILQVLFCMNTVKNPSSSFTW